MSASPMQVAKKLCELSHWTVSNLKIQKIIYLAHMLYLGATGHSLVDELFEAWMYGPVIPSLYYNLKCFGADPVKNLFYHVPDIEDEAIQEYIVMTWNILKDKKPSELVSLTHIIDGAWDKNYVSGEYGQIIPNQDIIEEYNAIMSG